jgi:uncharacterized protein YecE (DUF72 family)
VSNVSIGTSGWHYKHWRGLFYDAHATGPEMLPFYLRHFDTVEINNSFYRLPEEETFQAWREATPENFLFAVKASRFITHNKKLSDPQSALEKFIPRAEILGRKLGPILFQLPPRWHVNAQRLESFLKTLPNRHRYAFELRDPTWHTEAVYKLLQRHNAAFCIYELAGFQSPLEITADFTYVRLHGPAGKYQGSYSAGALRSWAQRIGTWRGELKHVYVYFDNDQEAFAARNALDLKRLLG